jgi:hypothetical protein
MTESDVVRRLHALPPVGSRVLVTYNCEYMGMEPAAKDKVVHKRLKTESHATDRAAGRMDKTWTRPAVVRQKINKGARSSVAVEIQPEQGTGKRGRYMANFRVTDIMAGLVKLQGVE